jgi:hypothetical protein
MTAAEIKQLIAGKSVYLGIEATSEDSRGKVTLFYTADGKASLARDIDHEGQHRLYRLERMPNNPRALRQKPAAISKSPASIVGAEAPMLRVPG